MQAKQETALALGRLVMTPTGEIPVEDLPWHPHPAFAGVSLKHLVTGADTGGALSCHLVRVDPGMVLPHHTHDPQWELHEVADGSGTAVIDGREAAYEPGVTAVIPRGMDHEVRAGETGLRLLAKFFPALL
jgi:quercetin dioxygenase-like cupin family protein